MRGARLPPRDLAHRESRKDPVTPPKRGRPRATGGERLESDTMPTDVRGRARKLIHDALLELHAANAGLFLPTPAIEPALASIARVVSLLSDVPAPFAIRTAPLVVRAAEMSAAMPPAVLRWKILELSTELLAAMRDLSRERELIDPEPE